MGYSYYNEPKGRSRPVIERAIFLDIEGVVVTNRSILMQTDKAKGEHYHGGHPGWHRFIDVTAMALVYKMSKDYEAQIVISSTLRHDSETYAGLCAVCPHWIDDPTEYVSVWVTPSHDGGSSRRSDEIKQFIKDFGVKTYVAIDDRHNMGQALDGNFVQTETENGLSWRNFLACCDILADGEKYPAPSYPIFL